MTKVYENEDEFLRAFLIVRPSLRAKIESLPRYPVKVRSIAHHDDTVRTVDAVLLKDILACIDHAGAPQAGASNARDSKTPSPDSLKALPDWIAPIRERLEKATPGPWLAEHDNDGSEMGCEIAPYDYLSIPAYDDAANGMVNCIEGLAERDVTFIAHAPSDIRRLIDAVERVEKLYNDKARQFVAVDMLHESDLCISLIELRSALNEASE